MLLKITERNAWEREAWSHIISIDKQDSQALNHLMIFTRLANQQFELAKEAASKAGHGSMFAASRYSVDFYDGVEESERSFRLKNKKGPDMIVSKGNSNYKSNEMFLNRQISSAKMKSAMVTMRDKKENVLYKGFESVFLKEKVKKKK